MKIIATFILAVCFFLAASAQDVTAIIKEADRLEAIPNEKAAFNKFKEALKIHPDNLYALVKCSELCSRVGKREATKEARSNYYEAAKIYAATALKVNAKSSDANAVMAIALGRTALEKSGKEKISAVKDIKKYGELAVQYDPNNFKGWHILGKWYYEVSNLNMFERAAAKVFFGGLPSATLKESIAAYEKAKALNGKFLLNYLELAKAYKRNDEDQKAIDLLKAMPSLPNLTEDDALIKQEGVKLLKILE
jgi:hypothetical protein